VGRCIPNRLETTFVADRADARGQVKSRLQREQRSRRTLDPVPPCLGYGKIRRYLELIAQPVPMDYGYDGCLEAGMAGDAATATLTLLAQERCVVGGPSHIGSGTLGVWRARTDAGFDRGNRLRRMRNLQRNLHGRICGRRRSLAMIVAWMRARRSGAADQEKNASQEGNKKSSELGPGSHSAA
jgi:hypothetical protein